MEQSRQAAGGPSCLAQLLKLLKLVQSRSVWNPHATPATEFYFKHRKQIDEAELTLFSQDERDDFPQARIVDYYLSSFCEDRDAEYPRRKLVAILAKMIERCRGAGADEGLILARDVKRVYGRRRSTVDRWEDKGLHPVFTPRGKAYDIAELKRFFAEHPPREGKDDAPLRRQNARERKGGWRCA